MMTMPTVAVVEGVKIQFFAREHPPPHFHAVFAEYSAQIDIRSLNVLGGKLPPAKLAVVISWAETRREALMGAWDTALAKQKPEKIR
jgi:hypothetical protein